jgi:hypothetical protein
MTYTVKPITQYAVINDENGLAISLCKSKDEATAIALMMAGHGRRIEQDFPGAKPYRFSDWAKK